jgi:hypothetical protein
VGTPNKTRLAQARCLPFHTGYGNIMGVAPCSIAE